MRSVKRPSSAKRAPPTVNQSADATSVTSLTGSPASRAAVTAFTRAPRGEAPAGGRRIEGEAERRIARRGDRRPGAQRRRDGLREPVRAVVPAQQRHDAASVLGDREHRRVGALVREMRSQEADEDAGGAEADDGPTGAEERRKMRAEPLVGDVGGIACGGRAVDRRVRQRGGDAPRERGLARIEDHQRDPAQRHAAPRRWTITMEK